MILQKAMWVTGAPSVYFLSSRGLKIVQETVQNKHTRILKLRWQALVASSMHSISLAGHGGIRHVHAVIDKHWRLQV